MNFCKIFRSGRQRPRYPLQVVHGMSDQDVPARRNPRFVQRRHPVLPSAGTARHPEHGVLGKAESTRNERVRPLQQLADPCLILLYAIALFLLKLLFLCVLL